MEKKSSKTAIKPILGMERDKIKILFVCHGSRPSVRCFAAVSG